MSAFHCITALFFRRAITDNTENTEAPALSTTKYKHIPAQSLVSKALSHLENIDALSHNAGIANTLWAGFVAAAETLDTGLRQRPLIWLGRAMRPGIGNIPHAMEIVMEIWDGVMGRVWRRGWGLWIGGKLCVRWICILCVLELCC